MKIVDTALKCLNLFSKATTPVSGRKSKTVVQSSVASEASDMICDIVNANTQYQISPGVKALIEKKLIDGVALYNAKKKKDFGRLELSAFLSAFTAIKSESHTIVNPIVKCAACDSLINPKEVIVEGGVAATFLKLSSEEADDLTIEDPKGKYSGKLKSLKKRYLKDIEDNT